MNLKGQQAAKYLAAPDPNKAGLLIFGADAMRVALKRQEAILALVGPQGEAEMRLTRLPAAELRKNVTSPGGTTAAALGVLMQDNAMRTLFERVQAELGPIEGVVHAAGLAGGSAFRAVADTGPGQFELHFHARVAGVDVLAQLVPASARFVALVSSLSTTLGGAGLLAYAAANHYLHATAATRDDPEGTRWCALGWDAWDHGGLGAGIRPSEGQAVFERALGLGCPRLIVSTVELASRQAAAACRACGSMRTR